MRILLLALVAVALLSGCGRKGAGTGAPGNANASPITSQPPGSEAPPTVPSDPSLPPVSEEPPVVEEPPYEENPTLPPLHAEPVECMLLSLTSAYAEECEKLIYNGEAIAGPEFGESGITLFASIFTVAKGDDLRFDAATELLEPIDLVLPVRIEVRGDYGNGKKVYVRLNAYTECAWTAQNGGEYFGDPVCFEGAERSPGNGKGFQGGIEVDHVRAQEVTRLEMTIEGSGGKKAELTTVVATFAYD